MTAQRQPFRAEPRPVAPRPQRAPVPSEAQQRAWEDRMVAWLVRVNEGWLRRQEAGR